MQDIKIPEEIYNYKNAKFVLGNDDSFCKIMFEFDIVKLDYLKPFVLLDYFPEQSPVTKDVLEEIIDGYCLTSDIDMPLHSRIDIVSRLISYHLSWDDFLKNYFRVENFRRDALNSVVCQRNIKDYYVICLMADPNFMKSLYIEKIIALFGSIESHILMEMKNILTKVSADITSPNDRSFIDFEINVIDQKIRDKNLLFKVGNLSIRKEAQRRLSPKISSLRKRMIILM